MVVIYFIFRHSMRKVPTVRPAMQAQNSYFTLTMTKNSTRSTGVNWRAHISCKLPPEPKARDIYRDIHVRSHMRNF